MGRKITAALLTILILCCGTAITGFAEGSCSVHIEQVYARVPDVDVYFYLLNTADGQVADLDAQTEDVSATLGSEQLTVHSVQPISNTDKGTRYIFLLDVSGSMPDKIFSQTREALAQFAEGLSQPDRLILVTFGKTVDVKLTGTENATDAAAIIRAVENDAHQTRFFDAIDKALELAAVESDDMPERSVLVAVTDGEDIYRGGNTESIALGELQTAGLPLYTLGIASAETAFIDSLVEFSVGSGGTNRLLTNTNVQEQFDSLTEYLGGCYVASMSAKSNRTDGTSKPLVLTIRQDGSTLTAEASVTLRSQPDTTAPGIVSVEATGENEITVTFSENVSGADNASAYFVISESGVKSSISQVYYDDVQYQAVLKLSEPIYNGEYTLSCAGVVDFTNEENALQDGSADFTVSDNALIEAGSDTVKESLIERFWWVIVGGVGLIALLIVLIVLVKARKKKAQAPPAEEPLSGNAEVGMKHHILPEEGRKVKLTISDTNGVERVLDIYVKDRTVFGRSDVCDIYFDDPELSRRHASIIYQNGELMIEDLHSTNGTYVNGIRINTPRRLDDGDVIEIGRIKMRTSL